MTTYEPAALNNLVLRLEADQKSFNQVVKIYEETHPGTKIDVTYKDLEKVKKEELGPNPGVDKFVTYLRVLFEEDGTVTRAAPASNGLWKDWNPVTVKDVVSKF